jgi:general stress protein 26
MAKDDLMKQVVEYLKAHKVMTLATVKADGRPLAHTVEYASDGTTVYFLTAMHSRKALNIIANQHVAFTVDEDYPEWSKIQGVQMEGKAAFMTEKADVDKAVDIYLEKFPAAAPLLPDPDIVFIKVEPIAGYFLDYSKGFAHVEELEF